MKPQRNLNPPIVDCDWAAWGIWADCSKATSCAMQGGGNRDRTRSQSITVLNSGDDCEAVTMEENWRCCADGSTDSTNCAGEVCLVGE